MARSSYFTWRRPPPLAVHGRTVILVDDGLATGASMRAAVAALRRFSPAQVVVAVPVGSAETCGEFEAEADEMVCATEPEPFLAVGHWYEDFTRTSDDEVPALLAETAAETHSSGGWHDPEAEMRKTDPKTGKRRNLGAFASREAAAKHEQEVQYLKRH